MGFVMNTMNTINRPRCFWLKHVNGQKLWRRLWGSFLRHYCGGGYGVRFEDNVEVAMGSMWRRLWGQCGGGYGATDRPSPICFQPKHKKQSLIMINIFSKRFSSLNIYFTEEYSFDQYLYRRRERRTADGIRWATTSGDLENEAN